MFANSKIERERTKALLILAVLALILPSVNIVSGQETPAPPPAQPPTDTNSTNNPVPGGPPSAPVPVGSNSTPGSESGPGAPTPSNSSKLFSVCLDDTHCSSTPNSYCAQSSFNEDAKRCYCKNDFHQYLKPDGALSCEQIAKPNEPRCEACFGNEGQCLLVGTEVKCSCPSSKSGDNCEIDHVEIGCASNSMIICYKPHNGVTLENNQWTMHAKTGQCKGYLPTDASATNTTAPATTPPVPANNSSVPVNPVPTNGNNIDKCKPGYYMLNISLKEENIDDCGTSKQTDPTNTIYANIISIDDMNKTHPPYVFNVYCKFQRYATGQYAGIGIIQPNGNDRGVEVTAKMKMNILNAFDQPLRDDAIVLIGDILQFQVNLTKDVNYKQAQVMRCYASTSFLMTDSYAETKSLVLNGCPVGNDENWLWKNVSSTETHYVLKTGKVPIFKLVTSENLYIYCAIKLCLAGSESLCPVLTKENCTVTGTAGRKKRSVDVPLSLYRSKRAGDTNPSTQISTVGFGIRVVDPNSSNQLNGPMATVFAIVFSVLIVAIIVAVVVGTLMMSRRKKNLNQSSERFAQPRVRTANTKF